MKDMKADLKDVGIYEPTDRELMLIQSLIFALERFNPQDSEHNWAVCNQPSCLMGRTVLARFGIRPVSDKESDG